MHVFAKKGNPFEASTPLLNQSVKKKVKPAQILWSIARYALLISLSFVLLYPLIYMLSMALRTPSSMFDPSVVWLPRTPTFKSIIEIWNLMDYGEAIWNTIVICITSSLFQMVSCALAGYGFARFDFKYKNLLFGGVLLSILVPPQTIIIPLFVDMRYFDFMFIGQLGHLFGDGAWTVNLYDSPFVMFIPALFANGIRGGLFIYIFRQFFRGLPRDLEDAAAVDGCSILRMFARIVIPCSGAAFLTVFLFSFVFYWNDYYYTGMFFSELNIVSSALRNLQTSISQLGVHQYDRILTAPYMQAGALLAIIFPLSVYLIFQRFFTESIERTGIVG